MSKTHVAFTQVLHNFSDRATCLFFFPTLILICKVYGSRTKWQFCLPSQWLFCLSLFFKVDCVCVCVNTRPSIIQRYDEFVSNLLPHRVFLASSVLPKSKARPSASAESSGSKSSLPSALSLHQGQELPMLLANISTSGAEDSAIHAAGLRQTG